MGQHPGPTELHLADVGSRIAYPAEADLAVARELAAVSRLLLTLESVEETLAGICRLAVEHIPGGEDAGVSLLARGALRSAAATSDRAGQVEGLQVRLREGPVLDVVQREGMVQVDDLETETRWAAFTPAALSGTGIRAMLSIVLRSADRPMGALSLYSSQPGAFDGGCRTSELAWLFAGHAADALYVAQALDGLRLALKSRETISVGMGVLMARQDITRAQAFDVMRKASQRENVKLRDIAARIAGGEDEVLAPAP